MELLMLAIIAIIIFVIIYIYKFVTSLKTYKKDFGYFIGDFYVGDGFKEDTWTKKEENCSVSNNGKMTVFTNKCYDQANIDLGRKQDLSGEKQVYKKIKVENRIEISCIPFNSEQECISHVESVKKYFNKPDHHRRQCYRFKNVLVIWDTSAEHKNSYGKVTTISPIPLGFANVKKNGGEVLWEDRSWDLPVDVRR